MFDLNSEMQFGGQGQDLVCSPGGPHAYAQRRRFAQSSFHFLSPMTLPF